MGDKTEILGQICDLFFARPLLSKKGSITAPPITDLICYSDYTIVRNVAMRNLSTLRTLILILDIRLRNKVAYVEESQTDSI
ncbi:hypothetical protein MASR2M64_14780 [Candidatus Cloacimonadota bacterium]